MRSTEQVPGEKNLARKCQYLLSWSEFAVSIETQSKYGDWMYNSTTLNLDILRK